MNTTNSSFNSSQILFCRFCGRECKSINSLKQHETRCKENPDRHGINYKGNLGHSWNKGKTKETDDRIKKYGETYHKRYEAGEIITWCQGKTKETDERINQYSKKSSSTIKEKISNDDWHLSFSKARTIEYHKEKFQGSWEVNFAKYLDAKDIKWIRPTEKFDYIFNNTVCKYLPDFYLPDYDLYIEIKGYPTERDFAKWNSFPNDKKLDVYFGDELLKLNIVDEIKNVYNDIPQKYRNKHIELF